MITESAMNWLMKNASTGGGQVDWSRLPEAIAASGGSQPPQAPQPGVVGQAPPPQNSSAGSRTYVPYQGDMTKYGAGPSHNFFEYAKPPVVTPPVVPPVTPPVIPNPGTVTGSGSGEGGEGGQGGAGGNGQGNPGAVGSVAGLYGGDDMTGSGRMPNASTLGVPGPVAGLASSIPGVGTAIGVANTVGNVANTMSNNALLGEMGYSMSPGQIAGGMAGLNGYSGWGAGAMNSAMAQDSGRASLGSRGPSSADVNTDAAFAAIANASSTSRGAPMGSVDSASLAAADTATEALAGLDGMSITGGDIVGGMGADGIGGRGSSGWEGSAFVGADYGSRGVAPGDTAVSAFGSVGPDQGPAVGSGRNGPSGEPNGDPNGGGLGNGSGLGGNSDGSSGDASGTGGDGDNRWGGRIGYANGGLVRRGPGSRGGMTTLAHPGGFIRSGGAGRADTVKTTLPRGSYVMPADVVSGAGQGNSLAGKASFDALRQGAPKTPHLKNGGRVPVHVSGGEYAFLPHEVAHLGGGSNAKGAGRLDQLVHSVRASVAHNAKHAKPPR